MTETPKPVFLQDTTDNLIGYTCERIVSVNTLGDASMTFYFDMSVPDSANEVAVGLEAVRQQFLQGMAKAYGFEQDQACFERVNTDWVVDFTSRPAQFRKVEMFETCRELSSVAGEDCGFYEGQVDVKVVLPMKDPDLPAVTEQIATIVDEMDLTNSSVRVKYIGAPVKDPNQGGDAGRDELAPPQSIEKDPQPIAQSDDGNTITIVGGLLVAAFVMAFLGILLVLWRRRQAYHDQRDTEFALSKSDLQFQHPNPTNTESKSHDAEDFDAPQITLSMEDGGVVPTQEFDPDETQQIGNLHGISPNSSGSYQQQHQPQDPMEFDFGNSFKDQLMGIHGRQAHPRPGYGMTMQGIPDSTSESDADSWAQTDGTIGSLELQLEPITAEV